MEFNKSPSSTKYQSAGEHAQSNLAQKIWIQDNPGHILLLNTRLGLQLANRLSKKYVAKAANRNISSRSVENLTHPIPKVRITNELEIIFKGTW